MTLVATTRQPFERFQRVLCVRTYDGRRGVSPCVAGRVYVIGNLHMCPCGLWMVSIGISTSRAIKCVDCARVTRDGVFWLRASRFEAAQDHSLQGMLSHMNDSMPPVASRWHSIRSLSGKG